jgi:hypothetical protein
MLASLCQTRNLPPRRQSRRRPASPKVSFTLSISPRYLQSNFPSLILLNSNTRLLSYEIHYFDTRCPNKLISRLAPVLESTNPIAPETYSLYSFRHTFTIAFAKPHHFSAREKQIPLRITHTSSDQSHLEPPSDGSAAPLSVVVIDSPFAQTQNLVPAQ